VQFELPLPETPPHGYTWRRIEVGPRFRKSHYELMLNGERTGIWVMHCGHPTALRPYYLAGEFFRWHDQYPSRKYRLAVEAKEAAIRHHKGEAIDEE
jgi:hypothetical protein